MNATMISAVDESIEFEVSIGRLYNCYIIEPVVSIIEYFSSISVLSLIGQNMVIIH